MFASFFQGIWQNTKQCNVFVYVNLGTTLPCVVWLRSHLWWEECWGVVSPWAAPDRTTWAWNTRFASAAGARLCSEVTQKVAKLLLWLSVPCRETGLPSSCNHLKQTATNVWEWGTFNFTLGLKWTVYRCDFFLCFCQGRCRSVS